MVKIESDLSGNTKIIMNKKGRGYALIIAGISLFVVAIFVFYSYIQSPETGETISGDKYLSLKLFVFFLLFSIMGIGFGIANLKKNIIFFNQKFESLSINQLQIPFSEIKNFIWVHNPSRGFMFYRSIQCVKKDGKRIDFCLPDNKKKEQEKIIEIIKSKGFEVKDALFELEDKA